MQLKGTTMKISQRFRLPCSCREEGIAFMKVRNTAVAHLPARAIVRACGQSGIEHEKQITLICTRFLISRPSEPWGREGWSGGCLSPSDRVLTASSRFLSRFEDFLRRGAYIMATPAWVHSQFIPPN
ncbi:hypothetical protein PR048_023243 [Dryococelus australis]|uniref:Uncharacterized protein n=1 Tax=Dryococelus australis TaxID=614101 RepID=A0ABQ9GTK6_9NEOP|nr:hypothetical protein PR048_023243 [Dryococelus australis]